MEESALATSFTERLRVSYINGKNIGRLESFLVLSNMKIEVKKMRFLRFFISKFSFFEKLKKNLTFHKSGMRYELLTKLILNNI